MSGGPHDWELAADTVFTMFVSGLEGMNRRIATYLPGLTSLNVFTSINGFLFGVGFSMPLLNVLVSAYHRGQRAPANAWGGQMLERASPGRQGMEQRDAVGA